MDYLEETFRKKHTFHTVVRKLRITSKHSIIKTPKLTGGDSYIKFLQSEEKQHLFIDLEDFRSHELTNTILNSFVKENEIVSVAINNYKEEFGAVKAPEVFLLTDREILLENFINYTLHTLDFEEFFGASKHNEYIEDVFDDYLKHGTILDLINLNEDDKITRMQEIVKLLFPNPTILEIFKFITVKTGFSFSLFQAFNMIKQNIKLSKDLFYNTIEDLKNSNYIFTVDKLNQPKAAKKFYPFDFALKQCFTTKKDLGKTLEHMIFLELIRKDDNIYYLDFVDFFLPNSGTAIIILPFASYEKILIKAQAALKNREVETIEIITLGYEYQGDFASFPIRALPFWQWAIEE